MEGSFESTLFLLALRVVVSVLVASQSVSDRLVQGAGRCLPACSSHACPALQQQRPPLSAPPAPASPGPQHPDGCAAPTVAVLYEDTREQRHVRTYEVSVRDKVRQRGREGGRELQGGG